jgi:putative Mg2+ transporter-C (MgtC) family protein
MLDQLIAMIHPLSWTQILTAIMCGGLLGLERQVRGRPAGVRTSIMICLGSEVFVHLGTTFNHPAADPTRVLGQVVNGIGFLGAGVMLARGSMVMGVTSASVIWMMAAVGSVIGLGYVSAAITLTVSVLAILIFFDFLESKFGYSEKITKRKTPYSETPAD